MVGEPNDNEYGSLTDTDKISEKHKRELGRIRSSPTFRLSTLFIKSAEKPWKLLWLPISILILMFKVVRERLGYSTKYNDSSPYSYESNSRESIVFFPTNGVGFGHFTRLLAIAKRIKKTKPQIEIIFFTTMPTLHLLKEEGFPAYHLPGRKNFGNMNTSTWNSMVEELLSHVFAIHRPKAFIFDGSYPYRGMLNAINRRDDISRIWVRRGSFKKNAVNVPVDSFEIFDYLVRPGDSVEQSKDEAKLQISTIHCDPIVLLDEDDILPSNILKSRLGIPQNELVSYVQLGAGKINDIFSDISIILSTLDDFGIWTVLGESLLGSRIEVSDFDKVRVIRDYPNSKYISSFDFGIISGGYNSFHEAVHFSLPCICIPNPKTGMDDQNSRANVASDLGFMFVEENVTKPRMKSHIEKIIDPEIRYQMLDSGKSLKKPNGAQQVAKQILELVSVE
tara:strand:- start:2629 stop:3978 length:1350 start_codon:yes stop_codon:yes gene_type:complete